MKYLSHRRTSNSLSRRMLLLRRRGKKTHTHCTVEQNGVLWWGIRAGNQSLRSISKARLLSRAISNREKGRAKSKITQRLYWKTQKLISVKICSREQQESPLPVICQAIFKQQRVSYMNSFYAKGFFYSHLFSVIPSSQNVLHRIFPTVRRG